MVTGIKDYSTTPGSNNSPSPNGFPEGMAPSGVNDSARQVMAEVRKWYEEAEWIDYGHDGLTYVGTTQFRVTGDQTGVYAVNRRVRAIGTTPFTVYGTITASSFSSPNTTVTVTWDSGSLDNTLSEIAVSITPTNKPIPISAIKTIGKFGFSDNGELTISSGAITITGVAHTVDTESDASSDDLDTINGGSDGELLILRAAHADRTVVVKDGTGNIETSGGGDISLSDTDQAIFLQYDAELSKWLVIAQPTASSTPASAGQKPPPYGHSRYAHSCKP